MDFKQALQQTEKATTINAEFTAHNPFAGRDENGNWIEGEISVDFLQQNFGQYSTAKEMIGATESEGLKKYFAWLKEQGVLG